MDTFLTGRMRQETLLIGIKDFSTHSQLEQRNFQRMSDHEYILREVESLTNVALRATDTPGRLP